MKNEETDENRHGAQKRDESPFEPPLKNLEQSRAFTVVLHRLFRGIDIEVLFVEVARGFFMYF